MLKYRSDQDYFFDLTTYSGQTLQNGAEPREVSSVPRTTVWSPEALKKELRSTARLFAVPQPPGRPAGRDCRGWASEELCHRLQVQVSGLIPLARPPRSTQGLPRNLFGRTTCGTVSSGAEIKPIPNPLAIQIVINNFSPWKHCALPGRRAVPDGLCTHRELEQVSDCTKTHR